MSISSLLFELWQFSFIRDWQENRKWEIPSSEFCPISGDWGELWIPNLARMSNRMLLNAANFQGYSFYRFWVIKGKPTGGGKIMHLKRTFLLVQKDATKEVYKYALEHLVCMEILTQVWKYFRRYHVPVYVYKYKGNCRCKSVVAKRSN